VRRAWAWLLIACWASSGAWGQDALPWHAEGWKHRALGVASAPAPAAAGHDVVAVRVLHAGRASASGQDYRVFDAAGRPLPYQLDFHDPRRDSLLRFRHPDPGGGGGGGGDGRVAIYFGNDAAPVDPLRVVCGPELGSVPQSGPGAGGWVPRVGLVLICLRRDANVDHPRDAAQFAALIQGSPGIDGADYRANIRDGANPLGDSDQYISIYRGWLHIPTAGKYGFCNASDEGSLSFLDGSELIHWPGRHTVRWGRHGDVSVERAVQAGPRYVEYVQEETIDVQMAFLGIKPPGSGKWDQIPASMWPQPATCAVTRYETAGGGRAVSVVSSLVDSVWPGAGADAQFSRVRLAVAGLDAAEKGWQFAWSLGDGTTATGHSVEHVYLCPGEFTVTLRATPPGGAAVTATWPLNVFPVRHVVEPFVAGKLSAYAPMVEPYDHDQLDARSLAGLALLNDERGESHDAEALARRVLAKPEARGEFFVQMALLAYRDLGGTRDGFVDAAAPAELVKQAQAALTRASGESVSRPRQLEAMAALIRVLGLVRGDEAAAEAVHQQARAAAKQTPATAPSQAALRSVVLAMGDVRLQHGHDEPAGEMYRLYESLAEPPMPAAVKAAKRGAWQEQIEQHAAAKRWGQVQQVARTWREALPSDQLQGPLLWWLGQSAWQQGDAAGARRPLELAIAATSGTTLEAEVRWSLAQVQGKLGDAAARKATLQALVNAGIAGPRRDEAIEALKTGK
jgi:hypothetical protein